MSTTEEEAGSETVDWDAQSIVNALKSGRSGTSVLRSLLRKAAPGATESAIVDLLTMLDGGDTEEEDESLQVLEGQTTSHGIRSGHEALTQELAYLREINDLAAAALGACPLCWGGDGGCEACNGSGSPGEAILPDPRLFKELVVPAVRLVRDASEERSGRTRARNDDQRRTKEAIPHGARSVRRGHHRPGRRGFRGGRRGRGGERSGCRP